MLYKEEKNLRNKKWICGKGDQNYKSSYKISHEDVIYAMVTILNNTV